jgi:hypothetical protein
MDPYLENPRLWPDVHNSLIASLRDVLAPLLRPRYAVGLEERTYLADPGELIFIGRPDLAVQAPRDAHPTGGGERVEATGTAIACEVPVPDHVRETYLEVRMPASGEVITVVELLSPTNKRPGAGRTLYLEKRATILGSRTNLVEIDLIRSGEPMPVYGASRSSDYRVLVSRGHKRPTAQLHVFSVRDRIPAFPLPLRPGDTEPEVDLGHVLRGTYERAGYDLRIDYGKEPEPPLAPAHGEWLQAMLAAAGARKP